MAYSFALGPAYSLGSLHCQEVTVTGDAATGNVAILPANTKVNSVTWAVQSATPQAIAVGYQQSSGTVFFSGNVAGASTTTILVWMP